MAANSGCFESASNIEERKSLRRQARKEAVEKAKQQYKQEERKKQLKRQRGEDTWMLPEINQRLQEIQDADSLKHKKKKEKKSKKKKKNKAKKERKASGEDDTSDGSVDSGDEWVEAQPQTQAAKAWQVSEQSRTSDKDTSPAQKVQRDEWMTFDFLAMKTTSTMERRAEKERVKEVERAKAQTIEQAGLHKLELNPYWKDGGTGLPPEEMAGPSQKKGPLVNDGGLSWLRKSYQRMKEQAERESRNLADLVVERYGSVELFEQRLADAEEAVYGQRRRKEGAEWTARSENESRERWRRQEGDKTETNHRRGNERDSSPVHEERYHDRGRKGREHHGKEDRFRDKDGGREKDIERSRKRERSTDREKEKEKWGASSAFRSYQSSSFGSHRSQFLKPSEDDGRAPKCYFPPAQLSRGFLKPNSDDEDSAPAWKKSSRPVQEVNSVKKQQEKEMGPENNSCTGAVSLERSESESEVEEVINLLTEEDMNKLGAKLVKAEIMGNTAMIEKLKSQLEAAHKVKESHATQMKLRETSTTKQDDGSSILDQEVLLFRTDDSGRAWPVAAPSGAVEPHRGRGKKKQIETHVEGQRVRYFQDDDQVGLKEMVRREKMSSSQDQNALYSRMAAKMMGKTDGDNYTLDDMFVSSVAQEEGEGREEERMRNRAIRESRRMAASMDKCQHCFSSQELQKHLVVAIGSKVYLSLPAGVSMAEGHCLICPLQHHCCATALDEDVWSEIQLFRRSLVQMFKSQDLDCVFMETHIYPRQQRHMVLECVPLPRELGDMAPIYFKKAIMECDDEWAMNKKVVDLSAKDIRRSVPRGLPYFAVDFGLQGGFAHVIENEEMFPHYFGKEVVGGMLDLEPRRWRKLIKENFDDQRKKVLQFSQWWKPFDCHKAGSCSSRDA
ncbi:hypothetical protein fugu_011308 [Takifugu bimaculatus]|uniref:CWF19-like protein 2 n=1 Tax=Takifugu bimaculatus TaxID=433685 RepID=A0A4Z2CCM7_9TELE|nr:hypothetical protein fugu_011308 [Takifugu bimaculatus]